MKNQKIQRYPKNPRNPSHRFPRRAEMEEAKEGRRGKRKQLSFRYWQSAKKKKKLPQKRNNLWRHKGGTEKKVRNTNPQPIDPTTPVFLAVGPLDLCPSSLFLQPHEIRHLLSRHSPHPNKGIFVYSYRAFFSPSTPPSLSEAVVVGPAAVLILIVVIVIIISENFKCLSLFLPALQLEPGVPIRSKTLSLGNGNREDRPESREKSYPSR